MVGDIFLEAFRDRWLAVGARAPRSCRLQQRVLLTVRTGLRGSLPLRSIGGFQHHSYTTVILWAVSTFKTKAYIAASCHGVVRRFVQHRWRVIDPRVSLVWFLSLKIFVCLVTVTRYFPSRVFMTFFLAWHVGATHAFDLYWSFCWMRISVFSCFCLLLCTVFLLSAAVFADLALYLAVCGLASVELSCSLTILVLQALLAPFPRLPILGAFRALFLSSSPARDLQH